MSSHAHIHAFCRLAKDRTAPHYHLLTTTIHTPHYSEVYPLTVSHHTNFSSRIHSFISSPWFVHNPAQRDCISIVSWSLAPPPSSIPGDRIMCVVLLCICTLLSLCSWPCVVGPRESSRRRLPYPLSQLSVWLRYPSYAHPIRGVSLEVDWVVWPYARIFVDYLSTPSLLISKFETR